MISNRSRANLLHPLLPTATAVILSACVGHASEHRDPGTETQAISGAECQQLGREIQEQDQRMEQGRFAEQTARALGKDDEARQHATASQSADRALREAARNYCNGTCLEISSRVALDYSITAYGRSRQIRKTYDRSHCPKDEGTGNDEGDENQDPKGDENQDPKGDENQDPKGDENQDPKGDENQDPKGDENQDPKGDGPVTPKLPDGRIAGERNAIGRGGWDNRHLSYRGRVTHAMGFDLQQLSNDPSVDYRSWLRFMGDNELRRVRLWLYTSWYGTDGGSERILHPWQVVRVSGKRKFDLDKWDSEYWSRLRSVVSYARDRGIMVEISLFSIQGPYNYFTTKNENAQREYAFRDRDNVQNFGRPDSNGDFLPRFFDTNYREGQRRLFDYQTALVDKVLYELRSYDNVYFELMNEAPGHRIDNWEYRRWAQAMAKHFKRRSTRLFTVHAQGYAGSKIGTAALSQSLFDRVGARFWEDANIDGLNFHLYTSDPRRISDVLHNHHNRGVALINNESGQYYVVDSNRRLQSDSRRLHGEIRHGWGQLMAASPFLAYHGPVESGAAQPDRDMANAMRAMRRIYESVPNWSELRPVRGSRNNNGSEYDSLVREGTFNRNWQVLADPNGRNYLVYLWGDHRSGGDLVMDLPEGSYTYTWYETRWWQKVLAGGGGQRVSGGPGTRLKIPSGWSPDTGVALVISR